jgi:hypothetical protein
MLLSPGIPTEWGQTSITPSGFGLQSVEFTQYQLSPFSLMRLRSSIGNPVTYNMTGLTYSNITSNQTQNYTATLVLIPPYHIILDTLKINQIAYNPISLPESIEVKLGDTLIAIGYLKDIRIPKERGTSTRYFVHRTNRYAKRAIKNKEIGMKTLPPRMQDKLYHDLILPEESVILKFKPEQIIPDSEVETEDQIRESAYLEEEDSYTIVDDTN